MVASRAKFKRGLLSNALAIFMSVAAILAVSNANLVGYAQTTTTGAISGVVSDASGAAVPSAVITITDVGTGSTRTVTANAEGRYTVGLLPPATYKISATAASLQSDTNQITIALGTTIEADIKVSLTGNKTVVEVSASAVSLVDTQNIALATTFTEQQIQELPSPGGDVTTVAFTAPGVVVNAGGQYGNFSSDGLPGISNLFVLNGFDNQDPFLNLNNSGSSNLTLGQGELAEATVVQNGYNSQYGRAAGAIINYTTKSGTNKFHGEAVYNYNGTLLNANGWFNNFAGAPRPHAVSNEWAANVGGPIIKDKVFFFADYEGLRYVLPASGYATFPSSQLQAYTLNNIKTEGLPSSVTDFYNQSFALYNAAASKYNAAPVAGACGFVTGAAAPGGGYFDAYPTKTDTGPLVPCMDQAFGAANNINKEWLFTGRGDWIINDKHKLYGRFKADHGSQPTSTSFINPLFDAVSIQPEYEGQLNDSYSFSPTKANVFVAAANWYSAYFGPANAAASAAVYPWYSYNDLGLDGSGTAESGGLTPLGVPFYLTQGRNVAQYQLEDDFLWVRGKHSLRFGANFRRDLVSDYDQRIETVFPFMLLLDLEDFTQGEVGPSNAFYPYNSFTQAFTNAPTAHLALYNVGAYVQDEYQMLPNLKLTIGARIDRTGNPLGHNGPFSLYKAGSFAAASLTDPYSSAAGGPINSSNWHPFPDVQTLNFQPRFGFNYSIDQKTEIRGGAGIFSDLYPAGFIDGVIQNYPNYNAVSITTGAIAPSGAGNVVSSAATADHTILHEFALGAGLAQTNAALQKQGVSANPPTIGAYFPSEFKVPEYVEYSLQIQRQLTKSDAIILTYAGNYGYDEVLSNPFVNPSSGAFSPSDGKWESAGAPIIGGIGYTPSNQDFGKITAYTNNAHSNYNGLQVNYKRNGHGVTGQLSYTWSHSLDIISNAGVGEAWNAGSTSNQLTPSLGYGNLNYSNSDYDIRHNITGDLVYEEPYKSSNKLLQTGLGGWVISAKSYYRTGEPFSIETAQSGDYGQLGSVLLGQTLPGVTKLTNRSTSDAHGCVYSGACFGDVNHIQYVPNGAQTTFGDVRRNTLYGPRYENTDLTVSKKFVNWEGISMRVGANAYNVFNRVNFANPGSGIGTSTFGQITSTLAPPTSPYGSFQSAAVTQRILQVFGKITF